MVLQSTDPEITERFLAPITETVGGAAAWLGKLYGQAAFGGDAVASFGAHARTALAATKDERILLAALSAVIAEAKKSGRIDPLPKGYSDFCGDLLTRVTAFYPDSKSTCQISDPNASPPAKTTVAASRLIRQIKPTYPPDAKARCVQGTVSFTAMIGKDGKILDLEFLDGPLALYAASRASVLQWEYQPTMVNGDPVQVSTMLNVNFTLGH